MNNKPSKRLSLAVAALILALLVVQITRVNAQDDAAIAAAKKIAEAAGWAENVTLEYDDAGNLLVLSNGMPNHEVLDAYQALSVIDNKTTYVIQLQEQRMKVVIPLLPKLAETKTSTEIGLIGVAISGGLFYSPFEADGKTMALSEKDLVIDGIAFFDSCNGHPNPFAVQYHYHGIPFCITDLIDKPGEHSRMLATCLMASLYMASKMPRAKLLPLPSWMSAMVTLAPPPNTQKAFITTTPPKSRPTPCPAIPA
jgi:hypothetical protein